MISFQDTEKAATKQENSEASCRTCTCGCKRGQTKEKNACQSTDRFDSSTLAFDCSNEEFRSIEASLYQVLHRTTANEPLRKVQQTTGQKGFEAWQAREEIRSEEQVRQKSACAALISNISERDRTKYVEQFDDILRTFINELNKVENRFGKIRDEVNMLAVKKTDA